MKAGNGRLRVAGLAWVMMLGATPAHAGDFSWNVDAVSPAINYAGQQVVTTYAPTPPPKSRVTAVHASRAYHGASAVQTALCFGKMDRCVPMSGSQMMTHAFDGMDAAGPVYMVHVVPGKGALPAPVFVKGSVVVWFSPPALPGR